jgi:hypothetical protein
VDRYKNTDNTARAFISEKVVQVKYLVQEDSLGIITDQEWTKWN